ncbi:MAG: hypothetical protein KIY12_00400 [Thermoplasmata archaeon]|uniref:Isoprenylcysteine carboxylmethyltransferase family protein n=1 Tax=Candidatus Sysuiplasma superficiale TaxID=2823368 RepID=A0A8J7YRC0_9ARCH|nr:hypothetical protein [Candidatus Sysuiplasma superficiale]
MGRRLFKGAAERTPSHIRKGRMNSWRHENAHAHLTLMGAAEKAVLVYIVAVLIPFGYIAAVEYSTPILGQALTWTYFNIFPWNFVIFSFFFLIGLSMIFWALSYTQGRGAERLLTEGPYSYTRNPKGFGYVLMLIGLGMLLQSAVAIFMITPAIAIMYFLYLKLLQEPFMRHRYGAIYDEYRASVPLLLPIRLAYRK